jgi:dipeptidyl aminopeptidase/acylaminoacyl peptidase
MADTHPMWIAKDEVEGIPSQARPDVEPPPHWRLEAVAATERPRSLTLGADGRTAVFIQDRDTSDVWILDLDEPTPQRLTTGREPAPFWEDTAPRLSPDGSTVAYADEGAVWLVPAAGGPPRRLVEGGAPAWIDDERLVIAVERPDRTTRLAVVHVADPWPRRLTVACPDHGDEWGAVVSPDGREVAYVFQVRADLRASEICVADVETGAVRTISGEPAIADRGPAWSPDGQRLAFASERSGWFEVHVIHPDGSDAQQLTHDEGDFGELAWSADGTRILATRGRRGRFDLVVVDATTGAVSVLAPGGVWSAPAWTADGGVLAEYTDHATPSELRLVHPNGDVEVVLAPAPLSVRSAPHVEPEEVVYRSFDGTEIHGFLFRPAGASADAPVPAVVYPHGGPTSLYDDSWDGHAQYFVDKGYAWFAINFRGSTTYGRDFERLNHGDWGIGDTRDCLAAADHLRTLDWVDGDRLGIFGASYGSYMALLAVTDDPERRFRLGVCKYGDCDIRTSWAQGDREGVQDLERMMGPPSRARQAYIDGSPVHRLEQIEVPLLIAHGLLDIRVNPAQSEELVGELRRIGGKTFEYLTYPTEAHGFLRFEPQLHFYRRLERFLDWHLM